MKLTIGMCCYDDYDGVWFTIQSIKMYHPECIDDIKFVVVDGNPESSHGKAVETLVSKLTNKHGNNGLYVKNVSWSGTASRDYVFEYATTPYVMCVDSHVMLAPGSIRKLLDYYQQNPDCDNLLQGPLVDEDGKPFANRMDPVWEYNMYGTWVNDEAYNNKTEPYEVDMMGLGIFCCNKQKWPGFNKNFRGFGGEEGYIHKKFKNLGRKTLILPWLKWNHRFTRPNGVPYRNEYIDRVKNYIIGWSELGVETDEIKNYYSKPNETPGQERPAIDLETLEEIERQYNEKPQVETNNEEYTRLVQENEQLVQRIIELELRILQTSIPEPWKQTEKPEKHETTHTQTTVTTTADTETQSSEETIQGIEVDELHDVNRVDNTSNDAKDSTSQYSPVNHFVQRPITETYTPVSTTRSCE